LSALSPGHPGGEGGEHVRRSGEAAGQVGFHLRQRVRARESDDVGIGVEPQNSARDGIGCLVSGEAAFEGVGGDHDAHSEQHAVRRRSVPLRE
jgi:hypothetical protein